MLVILYFWLVDTGARTGFADLRIQNDDMIVVLVNLGAETLSSYSLKLTKSALPQGEYTLESLMGDGAMPPLSVDAAGGLSFGSPLPALPPYATWILQLHPR